MPGYKANGDLNSVDAFFAQANNTLGAWTHAAGYYSAFHGKYVNRYLSEFFEQHLYHTYKRRLNRRVSLVGISVLSLFFRS